MRAARFVTWTCERYKRRVGRGVEIGDMRWRALGWVLPVFGVFLALAVPTIAQAADTGIDIVRIPPKRAAEPSPPAKNPPTKQAEPKAPEPKSDPPGPQQLGRFYKLPVRLGTMSSDAQKGWLGVRMDPVELPLALSLGLVNANGAFIVDATPGGPAHQAGLRFGDIVVSVNGKPIAHMGELRQTVSASTPGSQLVLEVWRTISDDGDFLNTLRRLADGGNAYIMYRLGRMYATGNGAARDQTESVRWYRKGADAGNLSAMTALGHMVLEGRGAAKDPQEGIRLLRSASDKGHLEAMHAMGLIMLEGKHVSKDGLEAVRLFTLAGDSGHTPSMVDIGLMYDNANGVQADHVKAAHWYRRAADLGNSAGMVNLGFLYARGKGVEASDTLAVSWYKKAVADGNPAGVHNLAAMADNGRGVDRDPEYAATLIMQALEMRYPFSYEQMTRNAASWTREFRRALQRKLRDAGVYSGTIDGEFGASTTDAIKVIYDRNR